MKQDTNFIEDPIMQAALSQSTVDLALLKGQRGNERLPGAVLSVVIPLEYLDTHAAYARLVVGCALWTMQRAPLARERVLFLMDEFPALKRMDRIAGGLATLRKYRVWLWPVIQNIGQLKELYRANWQTFVSNAGLKMFMGAGDLETAQYISELCGDATIAVTTKTPGGESVSPAARRLVTIEEVMHANGGQQIVFVDNLKPLLLRKTPYWNRPSLRRAFHRNPYQNGTPALPFRTPLYAGCGAFLRLAAWLAGPPPTVVALILFALATWSNFGISLGRETGGTNPACLYLQTDGIKRGYVHSAQTPCPRFIFTEL
jgi:type IV secretion system protein VirD4